MADQTRLFDEAVPSGSAGDVRYEFVGARRRIPPAPEFTPGQVRLRQLLSIATVYDGDFDGLTRAIRQEFFRDHASKRADPAERDRQQLRLARNAQVSMAGYGLYDGTTGQLTRRGREIAALPTEDDQFRALARVILLDLAGIDLLLAVRSIQDRGEPVSKLSLLEELHSLGFTELPRATTHHTAMAQWLRAANVLGGHSGWDVDDDLVRALTGTSLATVDDWVGLSAPQQAFIRTLRRMTEGAGAASVATKNVLDQAELEHGRIFRSDQVRDAVVRPLVDAGWIKLAVAAGGRGSKSGTVTPTTKLREADLERLTGYAGGEVPPDVRAKLDTPLDDVMADLESPNTHVKGVALELLAIRIASDLGLLPIRFRLRGTASAGAEVDLVAEGAHLHFSRWLFQCKNTRSGSGLEDLAREVGMATLLRAHVVVMVTTGRFSAPVAHYAMELASSGPLQVVLVDGVQLKRYRDGGRQSIARHFHKGAAAAMALKRPQVDRPIGEISG